MLSINRKYTWILLRICSNGSMEAFLVSFRTEKRGSKKKKSSKEKSDAQQAKILIDNVILPITMNTCVHAVCSGHS